MKKHVYLFALIACVISCGGNTDKDASSGNPELSLFCMEIELPDESSLKPLRLSEFVDSIEYLQLETTEECLIPYYGTASMLHAGNFLLMDMLQFDAATGKFIRRIGRQGQGPGEYVSIQNICINNDKNTVVVKDGSKHSLEEYDYEGKYLGNIKFDINTTDSVFATHLYYFSLLDIDNRYMIYRAYMMPVGDAYQPNEILIYDYQNKKVTHSLPNRLSGKYERYSSQFAGIRAELKQGDTFFYKSFYNDTLYSMNKEKGIIPYAVIDLNKRKLGDEVYVSKSFNKDIVGKLLIDNMYINDACILFNCFVPKDDTFKNSHRFICKYDKTTDKLTYHSELLINDIDGGSNMDISILSKSIGCVIPLDEIEEGMKNVFSTLDKSELKYPELKERFEQMQKNRNSDDNPLLMMLHMK